MEKQKKSLSPEEDALVHIHACTDKYFLEDRFIDSYKGRGVFTLRTIKPSSFVVEYRGNIFSHKDTRLKRKRDDKLSSFLYKYLWNGEKWCIDASKEDGSLGRLVNDDDTSPNCEMRKVVFEGEPHLCLFALRQIAIGEEITYNYGDSPYLWRSKASHFRSSTSWNEGPEGSCVDDEHPDPGPSQRHKLRDRPFNYSQETTGSLNEEEIDEFSSDADDGNADEDFVPSENEDESEKRTVGPKNFCFVCGKGVIKVIRHLARHADEEPEIAKVLALPKGSKEQKLALAKLRNQGNFIHNQKVVRNNSGRVKIGRRLNRKVNLDKYAPCLHCKGLFNAAKLWCHVVKCAFRKTSNTGTASKLTASSESTLWRMLVGMTQDGIALVIQNDYLLVDLAQYLIQKYGTSKERQVYIQQKLRDMGRLLLALHDKSVFRYEDAIKPKNFYKVVKTVEILAGFDNEKKSYSKPSLAVNLVRSLMNICGIVLSANDDNEKMVASAKKFMALCKKEWRELLPQRASEQKGDSPSTIPFTHDVQALYRHLESASATAIASLKVLDMPQVYNSLCRVTLAQVSVLNKRAPEVSSMTLKSFQEREDTDQVLSKNFIRINIHSKTNQNIAVLLTSGLVSAITLLVDKRSTCGVHMDNPFLFAKPDNSVSSLYSDRECVRTFLQLCNAKKPQHLKLASLQKHVARIFQILNLENDELDHLAKLLGHDIRTDRGYYRLPKAAVELAKIAKLLLAMEKGSLERYKGNSLNEIEIQDELESDLELAEPNESLEENTEELDVSQQQEDDMEEQDSEIMDALQMDLNAPTSSSEDEWVEASVEEVSSPSGSCYDDFSDEQASVTNENQSIQDDLETPLLESPTESNSALPTHCDSSVQQENEANYNSDDWSDGEPKTLSNSRKNFCYICGKAQSKISRHLKTHRKDVPEIAEVFALRRKSKERKKQIALLRNKGNFKHNQEVLKNRSGELKVRQSKGKAISAETFATCLYCKAMYCRKTIWLHYKKCASKKALKATNVVSTSVLISVPTMTSDPKKLPADVRNILKTMKKDEITAAVWSDPCVLQLAQCLYNSTKPSVIHIRHMVRLTGRLLLEFRKKSISSFDDAIKPDNLSKVHEAVKEMIGWETGKPKSLPKFRSLLKKVGEIKYAMALWEEAEAEKVQNADAFIKMVTEEWCQRIREKSIVSSVPTRPFIQDVQLLYQYMQKTTESAFQTLQMYESSPVYNSLLKVSFAQLLILNRNVRKVSRVTLKSFVERGENGPQMEAAEGQSQLEQILCKRFVKINVISKCGPKDGEKKVTVKMTPELLNAITLLVSKRENCGVSQRTPFLFAKTGAIMISVFHGQSSFNNAVDWCQAKNPKSLKSKGFRKHIERIFLIMCLSNEDLELLAKQLGRDIPTDKEYYQTPEAANDIAKISELLLAMENGCLDEYEGKSFEDIVLADELQPDLEQDKTEKSDASEEEDAESSFEQSAEQTNKDNSDVNSEDEDRSEDVPVKGDEKRLSPSNRDSRNMYSSDDEDMNVDFDVDLDTDDEREERGEPSRSPAVAETSSANEMAKQGKQKRGRKKKENSTINHYTDSDQEETRDIDSEEYLEEEEEQADSMDVDRSRSFATIDAEKRNKLLAKMMKEVKIVLPKLDIDKFKPSVPISELLSLCETSSVMSEPLQNDDKQCETSTRSADVMASAPISQLSHCEPVQNEDNSHRRSMRSAVVNNKPNIGKKIKTSAPISQLSSTCETSPVNSEPVQNDDKLCQSSTRPAVVNNKPNIERTMNATCSCCKKSIMKGQTAFQKKGFSDVFCSKGCLFEMFPINKPGSKICHHCNKEITQLLELVIAIVDTKGTTKDFCNVSCLCYFKSNISFHRKPQTLCRMCHKFSINTCDLILNGAVHKFCSYPCLESYRRDLCDNCSGRCYNLPLLLKLEEDTKNLCTEKCLQEFKEKTKTSYICIMCHRARPIFDMVNLKNSDGTVELFCSQPCVQSYQLQPSPEVCLQENQKSAQWQTMNNGNQPQENVPSEVVTVASDSSVIKNEPSQAAVAPRLCASTPCVQCSKCGKRMQRGETLYQPQNSQAIYCSTICLSESIKTCYNCCQVISRPRNIILAPVDRTGTMKELCSNACLSSVQTKRKLAVHKPPTALSRTECKMCAKFCHCPFKARVGRLGLNLCSSACFINYHKVNNLPVSICEICCSTVMKEKMVVKMEDGIKYVCSDQCFIKFKEKVDTLQLCPICQTSHQMSDMVENKNKDDVLDFFCSDRCLMVFKAQLAVGSDSFSERNSASPTEDDIKDLKPLLAKIKEEPMDVGYNQNPPSMSTEHIKDERGLAKEDLKLEEIVPPVQESVPPAPPIIQVAVQVTCASCKKVLMDREAFFQKKDHSDIFCSTSCLFKFYQMKPVTKTCQFCLEPIRQSQEVLQAPVDIEGTLKEFCSQTCLSSFIYKKGVSIKIPIVPVGSHSQCSMCNRYCISKHEVIHQDAIHKVCSDHCYLRFCNIHSLSLCINCRSCYDIPIMLLTGGVLKKLCSADCLAQIKKKILMPQLCAMCHTSKPISDMVENKSSDDVVELFCSSSCVMASKIQTVSATGAKLECDNCKKNTVPACYLAMADASFRNFCSLTCAMVYKETQSKSNQQEAQKEPSAATKLTESSDQTHDPPKLPDELLCANCQHIIKNKPKLVQEAGKVNFLCSLTCCEVFKQSNNITGKCEYCQSVRPVYDVQRVNNKDCCFCSEGCKRIFCKDREKEWGKCCPSCAYCSSLSITLVTARYGERDEDFCSEDCSSKYNKVFSYVAKCDTCGRKGELKKSLYLLGHVMHFCNLKCLLHFCRKMVQMKNAAPVSSSSASVEPPESSPVISNVISLAGYLAQYNNAKANQTKQQDKQQCTPLPETKVDSASATVIQTKVFGHASVQTETKELKNKSLLCTPLVHNKGVSCTTATAETEAQTDNFFPKVIVLPIPVPVYVPLPMNMYSQYTPQPVALPLPLPVPMFLPEPSVKATDEKIQQEPSKEDLDFRCEAETKQDNGSKVEDRLTAREMTQIHSEQIFEKDSFADVSLGSSSGSHTPAAVLHTREEPQSSTSSSPVPPHFLQIFIDVHGNNNNTRCKIETLSKAAEEETPQKDCSKVGSIKYQKLDCQFGLDAWRRWIQWRKSQIDLDIDSSHSVTLKENILHCSASELSNALSHFITEGKQADGEPYSPDTLFYLCLSIQQYLFDNDRVENIFSDLIYKTFSTEFIKILRDFKPPVSGSGLSGSCVEEDFLWECKQLGTYSPIVLLNTLLFFFCKFFGFTTVEQHHQLSFARLRCCSRTGPDKTKTTYLRLSPPSSTKEAESDTDEVPAKKRKKEENKQNFLEMMENLEDPLRCPVRLFQFYLSKCSDSMRNRSDVFYLLPERRCFPSSLRWFSSTRLDDGPIEAMLMRSLAVQQLREGT